MVQICDECGSRMTIKVVHEGTPYEDFDGFECPHCEQLRREARSQFERDNADILEMIQTASELKKAIRSRSPYAGMSGWDKINRWYASALKKFM